MGNSNTTNAVRKSVPWIALLVALAALGLGLWLLLRKPKAGAAATMTSPSSSSSGGTVARSVSSSGSISVFDLREMSYFPRGLVDPVRASVNRVLARVGDVTTKVYARDKANIDRKLKVALDEYEKEAVRYTTYPEYIAALMWM